MLRQPAFGRLAGYEDVNDADRSCYFMPTPALPKTAEPRSLTSLREKLAKIGAKVVRHGRCLAFQPAEVAVSRQLSADILQLIARLRAPSAPA